MNKAKVIKKESEEILRKTGKGMELENTSMQVSNASGRKRWMTPFAIGEENRG